MAELRWNPLINDWTMIASHRQGRPQMPKDFCPFCPKFGKVPEYEVYKYDNDFPALSQTPPPVDDVETDYFKALPAYGKCEVILYSPEHTKTMKELSLSHLKKLVDLWTERYVEIKKDPKIKYIMIFENRGEVVGVTMPHPHGQIYGYSVMPKKLEVELPSFRNVYKQKGISLIAELLENERADGRRIIFENNHFTVFVPFFGDYPYGVYVASRRHVQSLEEMTEQEKTALADVLKNTAGMYDSLFNNNFPYMMCMYNAPCNSGEDTSYFHFHIIFYPPMRSADKQKFNASSETGSWACCNTVAPEEAAEELRAAYRKFTDKKE